MAGRYELSDVAREKLMDLLTYGQAVGPTPATRQLTPRASSGGIHFANTSGETIPAFAVMQINDAALDRERPYVEVVKPTSSGRLYLFNGPRDVADEATALGYREGRALVSGSTTSDLWGPVAGEWELASGGYQFELAGELDSETSFFLLAGHRIIRGQTNASHAKGATGTIRIYSGSTDTGRTISAVNDYADLGANKKCHAALGVDGIWYLIAGEC